MAGNGAEELARLGARLKVAGDGQLRRKLLRTVRASAQPLVPAVRAAAVRKLPHSGGLNEHVANQQITVSVLTSARSAGVRLRAPSPDAGQTNKGYVRHPVFARKAEGPIQRGRGSVRTGDEVWVTQQIPGAAGWWSDTLREKSPTVAVAVRAAMAEVAVEIEGGL